MPTTTPEQSLDHLRDTLLGEYWSAYIDDDIMQAINNVVFSFDETESLANFFEQWKDQGLIAAGNKTLNPDIIYVLPTKETKLSTTPTLSEDLIWKIKM